MKNLFQTATVSENFAGFLFMGIENMETQEQFTAFDTVVIGILDNDEEKVKPTNTPPSKTPPHTEIINKSTETITLTNEKLIAAINNAKLPPDIKESVTKILKNANINIPQNATLSEQISAYQNYLNIHQVANRTHVFLTIDKNPATKFVDIDKISMKNPFPNGSDNIQNKLDNSNSTQDAKGYITEGSFMYFDKTGKRIEDSAITLKEVLTTDLAPLKEFNITSNKLQQIISNDSFTIENAKTIVNAINGNELNVEKIQIAFSNISKKFKDIVNGIDNKYGENTRKGVRSLSLTLAEFIKQKNEIPVKIETKDVQKWYLQTEVNQSFGGVSGTGFVYVPSFSIDKQIYDEGTYTGNRNIIILTPIYSEKEGYQNRIISRDVGQTVKYKEGKRIPMPTPLKLTKEVITNNKIIKRRNKKLESRKNRTS